MRTRPPPAIPAILEKIIKARSNRVPFTRFVPWLASFLAGAALLTTSVASAQVDAFLGPTTFDSTRTDPLQAGWGFYANSSGTAEINELGLWVPNGGTTQASHTVALYDFNSGVYNLVTQATIPAGTVGDGNGFAWAPIVPVTLTDTRQGGDYYIVTASLGTDPWGPYTGNSHPTVSDSSFGTPTGYGWFTTSALLPQPTESFNGYLIGGYIGPNIGYLVPTAGPAIYWKGTTDGVWSDAVNNWTTDAGGSTPATLLPSSTNSVSFAAAGATTLSTTLGQDFSINGLNFTTSGAVTIGGANTLTLGVGGLTLGGSGGSNDQLRGQLGRRADLEQFVEQHPDRQRRGDRRRRTGFRRRDVRAGRRQQLHR